MLGRTFGASKGGAISLSQGSMTGHSLPFAEFAQFGANQKTGENDASK